MPLPPALEEDDPYLRKVAALAAEMVVCVGYCEAYGDGLRYNAAICVSGDGVLGRHRKVHQPRRRDDGLRTGPRRSPPSTPRSAASAC